MNVHLVDNIHLVSSFDFHMAVGGRAQKVKCGMCSPGRGAQNVQDRFPLFWPVRGVEGPGVGTFSRFGEEWPYRNVLFR